jgi:ABC-2 type transport system permease protein
VNNILIIAAREFRQIAGMRSFWLTLLILPLALAFGPLTQRFLHQDEPDRVAIIDQGGGSTASAIKARLTLNQDRAELAKLSRYVQDHQFERADAQAPWAQHDRWYDDADVAAYRAAGGLPRATALINRVRPPSTPVFDPPELDYQVVDAPATFDSSSPQALERSAKALTAPADKNVKAINYIVLIPRDFAARPVVRIWADRQPSAGFITTLQDVLTKDIRARFLTAQGLAPGAAAAAQALAPALSVITPPPGGGVRETMLVRSILPLAAAYMLLMSLMLSGSWMLQGTVEERSNKLLETVLACTSPEDLMYGKLLGTLGVGLSMIAVWIGCAIVAAFATQGAIADFIRPALEPLMSPFVILTMIYFFIMGYVGISVIFLAIGGMSDSMRDAQGYLMPVLLAILLPITLLIQAILGGAGGVGVEVLTWVPIWTPFAVLARLGTGIPTWEILGAGAVLAIFTAIEIVFLGRLFRSSLLAQGQKPSFRQIIERLRGA